MLKKSFVIKLIISLLLLYFIIHNVEISEIFESIKNAKFEVLIFAFSLHFIGLMLSSLRWKVLLNSQNVNSKIFFLFKSYLVASFFNHFLPSTIGGDSVRAYDSWRLGDNRERALAVVILDRFLGLLTLLLFALISMVLSPDLVKLIPNLWFWAGLLSIGAIGLIWFIFSPPNVLFKKIEKKNKGLLAKVSGFIYKIDVAFSRFSNKRIYILAAFLLSILLQFNVVFYYFAISFALGLNVLFIDLFLIVPIVIIVTMIPISFNGIGLRENALFLFLTPFGVLQSQAIAFAWIEYVMLIFLGIIGGIIYMLRK
ncbi:MAG: lysylphosphatidylglycerol synthase transmembrane domain-containing protein [Melioribacteraceae bacterium]